VAVNENAGLRHAPASEPPRAPSATIAWVAGLGTPLFFQRFARDPLWATADAFRRYGPLYAFRPFGRIPRRGRTTLFAVGAEYNRAVLSQPKVWHTGNLPTGGPPRSALFRLGENVVSLNGKRHDYYRRLLLRPLSRASVQTMGDDIASVVNELVDAWPLGVVDLWLLAKELMRTVAVVLLFSGDKVRGERLDALVNQLVRDSKSPGVYLTRAGFPGRAYNDLLHLAEEVEQCALEIASAKRSEINQRDLIALIVNSPDESGAPPKPDTIAGQIPILFGAAYETCQTVLSWTLYLLAQHPQVARDLFDEVSGLGDRTHTNPSSVNALPLLDAVVRESMRILPPVPFQTRIAASPGELSGNEAETGTYVLLNAFLTNRSPNLYDDPERFKPERWSRINPSAFESLAFSAGPRGCPGAYFGMSVVKVALAAVLSRFRFSLVPESRVDYAVAITMAPSHGLRMILHPPDGAFSRAPTRGAVGKLVSMPTATR
jgi:cytochrome P450